MSLNGASVRNVGQQRHEPGPLDGSRHGVLARRCAPGFPTTDNLGLPIDYLAEQIEVLVIDEHRPRPHAVNKDRVFPLNLRLRLGSLPGRLGKSLLAGHRTHGRSLLVRYGLDC